MRHRNSPKCLRPLALIPACLLALVYIKRHSRLSVRGEIVPRSIYKNILINAVDFLTEAIEHRPVGRLIVWNRPRQPSLFQTVTTRATISTSHIAERNCAHTVSHMAWGQARRYFGPFHVEHARCAPSERFSVLLPSPDHCRSSSNAAGRL